MPAKTPKPDPAAVAAGIRECINVMANDLETIRACAGDNPDCEDAVKRVRRQVAELERLAGELHPPPV